jgi:hypothetical protein
MQALLSWHHWRRQPGARPTRAIRVADDVIAGLDQREQQAVDLWLGGAYDKVIAERAGLHILLVAQVRREVLDAVVVRLHDRRQRDDDVDRQREDAAVEAAARRLMEQFAIDGDLDLAG